MRESLRADLYLKGPFHEGDVLHMPYKIIAEWPIAREEPDGWLHYVVLRKIGRRKYRLEGVRGGGEVRSLKIALRRKVSWEGVG